MVAWRGGEYGGECHIYGQSISKHASNLGMEAWKWVQPHSEYSPNTTAQQAGSTPFFIRYNDDFTQITAHQLIFLLNPYSRSAE